MHKRTWLGVWLSAAVAAGCGGVVSTSADGDDEDAVEAADGVHDGDGDGVEDAGPGDDGGEVPLGCGNGVVDTGEDCDDGNTRPGDGCENDCTFTCEAAADCDDGEECNGAEPCTAHVCAAGTPPADGSDCLTAGGAGGVCRGQVCTESQCGNSLVEPGEDCDDGNTIAGDGCENDCTLSCRLNSDCLDDDPCNGVESCSMETHACVSTEPPEGMACRTSDGAAGNCRGGLCVISTCGDGRTDAGEECDDGNASNTDGCLSDCSVATCGDDFVWEGVEDCDGAPAACETDCDSIGARACDECRLADACTPPAEVCNGADDDCDTACDDGFGCCLGSVTTGTEGSCSYSRACEAGCIVGAPDFGAAPTNDTCAGVTPITLSGSGGGGSATIFGSTCAAADDYAPPTGCAAVDGPDVVFSLTLSATKFVVVDTDGSSFDTVLELRGGGPGTACPGTTSIACNDDRPTTGVETSMVSARLGPGTYYVILDGYNGDAGDYTLHVYTSDPPANDTCATAVALTPSTTPATVWGSNVGATDDGVASCTGVPTAGPDVWYSLSLGPARHMVYLDLLDMATWPGSIRIYSDCDATSLPIACAGGPKCGVDRPQWIGVLGRDGVGSTYYIAVDSPTAADSGAFALRHQMAGPTCTDAVIVPGPSSFSSSVPGGTGRSIGSCGGNGSEVFYALGLCPGRSVVASTCNATTAFESVLYARRNGCDAVGGAIEVACSAVSSGACTYPNGRILNFGTGLPTGLYFLIVDSASMAAGARAYQVAFTFP